MRKKRIILTAAIALMSTSVVLAGSNSIELQTYYPAPSGSYQDLTVTNNLTINGQTLNVDEDGNIAAPKIKATTTLLGPGNSFTADSAKVEIPVPMFTGDLIVGKTTAPPLRTRYIVGKETNTPNPDHLILQFGQNKNVEIGRAGGSTTSNLIIRHGKIGIYKEPEADLHLGGSNKEIRFDYNNTNSYYGSLRFAGLQLGNNGENRIVAGRTQPGGRLAFYVNNTNDGVNYGTAPNGVQAMTILSNGNVGINTSSPEDKLQVFGNMSTRGGSRKIQIRADGKIYHHGDSGGWALGTDFIGSGNTNLGGFGGLGSADSLIYYYVGPKYNDTRMVWRDSKVGINTPAPSYALDVVSVTSGTYPAQVRSPHGYLRFGPANDNWSHFNTDRPRFYFNKEIRVDSGLIGSYNEPLQLRTSGTTRVMIRDDSGNVGIGLNNPTEKLHVNGNVRALAFYYSSDKNLKENIKPLKGALDKVKKINGVRFDWKEDKTPDIGVIAQNVEEVLPELVNTDAEGIKSVKYGNLVAVLIEAVKEQQKQIDGLEEKIKLMEDTKNK